MCPYCGSIGDHYKLEGKAHRKGLWKCSEKEYHQQFSVTVGTVFERSKIPLSKWLAAAYLLCFLQEGHQLAPAPPDVGVTYKTAWFLTHQSAWRCPISALGR